MVLRRRSSGKGVFAITAACMCTFWIFLIIFQYVRISLDRCLGFEDLNHALYP